MIRDATPADAEAITEIYNDGVLNLTANWSTGTTDAQERRAWIAARQGAGQPVLVTEADGRVVGLGSYGRFREKDGYDLTVEHSLYIRPEVRGQGLGTPLLAALIDHARGAGMHVMVGAIDGANDGSIRLHERFGFACVGRMPQVGKKFGRWLDLALYQLVLDERPAP